MASPLPTASSLPSILNMQRKKEDFLIAGKVVLLALCEAVMGFSCDLGECGCLSRLLAMGLLFLVSKIWSSEADTGTRKHMPES